MALKSLKYHSEIQGRHMVAAAQLHVNDRTIALWHRRNRRPCSRKVRVLHCREYPTQGGARP